MKRENDPYDVALPRYPTTETLYEHGITLLKGMGFSDEEIHKEYWVNIGNDKRRGYRIDLVGIRKGKEVAVEIGSCDYKKLFALDHLFDQVIWLPFWFCRVPKLDENLRRADREISILKDAVSRVGEDNVLLHEKLHRINVSLRQIISRT